MASVFAARAIKIATQQQRIVSSSVMKLTARSFSSVPPQKIKFRFLEESSGDVIEVEGEEGQTVLDVALKHDINIEGACGGELACSTCHVVCTPELFKKLPAKKVEEEDMLDLAWGITDTSRLCCQLKVTPTIKDTVFKVPKETNNML